MKLSIAVRHSLVLLTMLLFAVGAARADLILTAPPRETAAAGNDLYGPLSAHLSTLLGTKVTYQHPGTWPQYTRDMRAGVYDIVFDGPHFTSWRMKHVKHEVLVRLPGQLVFHVVAKVDDDRIQSSDDLAGLPICGVAPPNLGTMALIRQFPNAARQPVLVPAKGGFKGVYKALESDRCRAAVLRTQFYDKGLSDEQRAGLKIIATSAKFPNQSISAGPNVTAEQKRKIVESLMGDGVQAAKPIFERFARNASKFQAAEAQEFTGHNFLLEGVIWGW